MHVGKLFIVVGIMLIIIGSLWTVIGKLPGDVFFKKGKTTVYIPIMTSIILSIVISFVLYIVGKFR